MILAILNTAHFEFVALDHTEEGAADALILAWLRHCEQYTGADPQFMTHAIHDGEVNFHQIAPGVVLRDGSPL